MKRNCPGADSGEGTGDDEETDDSRSTGDDICREVGGGDTNCVTCGVPPGGDTSAATGGAKGAIWAGELSTSSAGDMSVVRLTVLAEAGSSLDERAGELGRERGEGIQVL